MISCSWCDEILEITKEKKNNKVIIHKCSKCGKIVGAYQNDLEEFLINFFQRYIYTFKPEPSIKKL